MSTLSLSAIALIVCAFFAGAIVPVQAVSNAVLARHLGHPLWASLVSLLISIIVLAPLLFIFKVPKPVLSADLLHQPFWIWIGGIAGISDLCPDPGTENRRHYLFRDGHCRSAGDFRTD